MNFLPKNFTNTEYFIKNYNFIENYNLNETNIKYSFVIYCYNNLDALMIYLLNIQSIENIEIIIIAHSHLSKIFKKFKNIPFSNVKNSFNEAIKLCNGEIIIIQKKICHWNIKNFLKNYDLKNTIINSYVLKNIEENDKYLIKNKINTIETNISGYIITKENFNKINGIPEKYFILNSYNEENLFEFLEFNKYFDSELLEGVIYYNSQDYKYEINNLIKYNGENVIKNSYKQKYFYNKYLFNAKIKSRPQYKFSNYTFTIIENIDSSFKFFEVNMLNHYKLVNNGTIQKIIMNENSKYIFNDISFLKNKNTLYIFDDLILKILSNTYLQNEILKNEILETIKNINYIYICVELYYGDKLQYTGSGMTENFNFVKTFLKYSKQNYMLNTNNMALLLKENIRSIYYPCYSYNINNEIEIKENKTIDVLFYGNNPKNGFGYFFSHRSSILNELKKYSEQKNINCLILENVYDKNELLSNTKIVLQIPNYKNFHSFPWAKTLELMNKKIFFIIEENEEMYIKNLENLVVFYKRNNIENLFELINYYLQNDYERNLYINKCYKYVKNNFNINIFD